LDKGRQAGVLEGMEFYYMSQPGYGKIKVKTVLENSAEAVAEIFENGPAPWIGVKVSTRAHVYRPETSSDETATQLKSR